MGLLKLFKINVGYETFQVCMQLYVQLHYHSGGDVF